MITTLAKPSESWTRSDGQMAEALGCDAVLAQSIIEAVTNQSRTDPSGAEQRHSPRACVSLAIVHALHRHAGLALRDATAVAANSAAVITSVLKVIDFDPPDGNQTPDAMADAGSREADPFMLFAPHAAQAFPVAAIDHYLDITDGKRIFWKRPRRDAYGLACELHRLSASSRRDEVPAIQEAYLEALCRLRAPADHVCDWLGTVADGRFQPAPDRFPEHTPSMKQGPDDFAKPSFVDCYGTKASVNISLAARVIKRRALGLAVAEPIGSKETCS